MCCISWVHSEIGVILEDVWLEILLNDSIHANPVEERKQIHFVQNGVETKVDEEVQRVVDCDVSQAYFILEEITLPHWILIGHNVDEIFFKSSFFLIISFDVFFGHALRRLFRHFKLRFQIGANFFIFVDFSFLLLSWGFGHLFLGACGEGFVRHMLFSLFWLQEAIITFELQLSFFKISDHINKELICNRFVEVWVTVGLCHCLTVNILQGFQDSACEVTFFVEADFFAFIIEELGLLVFLVFVLFIFMLGAKRSPGELVLLSSSLAIELVANG
jgi:hypothetical protein